MRKIFSKKYGPSATWIVTFLFYLIGFLLGGFVGELLQTFGLFFLLVAIWDTFKYLKQKKSEKPK